MKLLIILCSERVIFWRKTTSVLDLCRTDCHAALVIHSCISLCCTSVSQNKFLPQFYLEGAQSRLYGLESLAKLFNLNPWQSSPSSTILVPVCFVIISLAFFYLCKVLFSGFLQFNSNFVDAQNNSKCRDWAPLSLNRLFAWKHNER